ncbi:MAG TPA: helix-turn-helix transcriptional regulator [Acidobacteriota bacterium]|jgi:DNA-binding PadR family transcriptional regulator
MRIQEAPLGFALLGLIHQEPRSGYDLRKVFATTPLMHFSDSPGAIYPALRRLRQQRLITTRGLVRRLSRRKQVFTVTSKGIHQLKKWLSRRIGRPDVVWHKDQLMLRLAFMSDVLGRRETIRFLEALRREIASYVAELTTYHASAANAMPLSGRLAMESGIESYKAQLQWARRALRKVKRKRKI